MTQTRTDGFVLTRVFDAPVELVWRCFTEQEHLAKWSAPRGYTITAGEGDVREPPRFGLSVGHDQLGPPARRCRGWVIPASQSSRHATALRSRLASPSSRPIRHARPAFSSPRITIFIADP